MVQQNEYLEKIQKRYRVMDEVRDMIFNQSNNKLMNEHELPNDIRELDNLYESPEDEIKRLEQIIAHQGKTILRQSNIINELSDKEAKIADKDLIWGLHQVVKFQEKEITDIKNQIIGHLPCLNQNY